MIKAVLFDLDGTLIDTPKLIMGAFKTAIETHTNYELSESEITNVLGMTLERAFGKHAKDETHYLEMVQTFRDYSSKNSFEMLKPYKNCQSVIQYLRTKGYLVGIVTSKNKVLASQNIKDVGLEGMFDVIVGNEDSKQHKPNPEPLLVALKKLNVSAESSIYIGDHENDIKAGNSANMKTGLMGYSNRYNEALLEKPSYVFMDLDYIKEIL